MDVVCNKIKNKGVVHFGIGRRKQAAPALHQKTRKEGTMVYYYLDPAETEIEKMIRLFTDIRRIM